ncbi:MAG: hypothetical protein V1709_04445 [Planctomycetota bacterium]
MELSEFIKETLVQVHSGMKNANDEILKQIPNIKHRVYELSASSLGQKGSAVEFDVAVVLKSEGKTGGDIGLRIAVVEATLGKTQQSSQESVSRIKFKVDVKYTCD